MTSFADRVILITGAGSGIGRRLALDLAAEGARIAAVDVRADLLESLALELKGKPFAHAVADVTDFPALSAAVAQLEAALGPTDVLVASAGVGRKTSGLEDHAADFASTVQINLIGVSNSIFAVLPGMRRRRAGHLVALSSLASYHGIPLMGGYCASKAGVNALMDALRVELRPLDIVATTICPGWIHTPMTAQAGIPDVGMMELGDAVRRMIAAIRARKAFVAFPPRFLWQVRLLRYLPRSLADRLAARLLARAAKLR
jgi:NAD(P)-dependent dehydrogenase (short-subunit alcohol dehydrogenase family)